MGGIIIMDQEWYLSGSWESKGPLHKVGFDLVASSLDKSWSRKSEDLQDKFIFLPSLFESQDQILVKWGSLSHPKISDFRLCIENTN